MTAVMTGVRVLEVASWTFVPAAGAVLADWGADVVKVEHPLRGDPQRGLVYGRHSSDVNYLLEQPNRGKRSIGLDISKEEGRELLYRLVERSDVFLTNYLPDVRRRLQIDVEHIRSRNPRIIYVRGTGQGLRGPDAESPGFDGTSFWSRGGLAHSLTPAGASEPVQATPAIGDTPGGMTLAGGIAGALFHRERTGEATTVDVSLLATAVWALAPVVIGSEVLDVDDLNPLPRVENSNPLTVTYRTRDGRFIKLSMLESDRFWPDFCALVDRPELVNDERFADSTRRSTNAAACVAALDDAFAQRSLAEWRDRFAGMPGAWAVVQTPREVFHDPQVVANGYVQEVETGAGRKLPLVANPVQFGEASPRLSPAPAHGQHTEEVLLELGLDWGEIAAHKDSGAVM